MTTVLDPTAERTVATRARLARPERIEGMRIGLLDIAKTKGDIFLDRMEQRLTERGFEVTRYAKPTNTRPAPTELSQQIATEVDLVVEALSD
jgi:hypothetical protein